MLGLDGARCRLDGFSGLIDTVDMPKGTRRKLRKQTRVVGKRLPAAAGTGKKAVKAKRQVNKGLKALDRTLRKAQRKLAPDALVQLTTELARMNAAVGAL